MLDRAHRAERLAVEAERRAERQHRAQVERAENAGAWALLVEAQRYAALLLLASGLYYRHKGQWRKRGTPVRDVSNLAPSELLRLAAQVEQQRRRAAESAALPPLPAPDDTSPEARAVILCRADRPDATAEDVAAMRRLLRDAPELIRQIQGPIQLALEEVLQALGKNSALQREVITNGLARQRAALGYAAAPALERPLIDHVLLCELRLMSAELNYRGGQEADRRLSAVQRRYLAAVEALARVRRVRVELARITAPDGSTVEAAAIERHG